MYKKMFLLAGIASVLITSCKDDDNNTDSNEQKGGFLIETTVKNADGMSGSTYMQLVSEFSGKTDNSNAIQLDFTTPTYVYGDAVYTLPPFGPQSELKLRKYTRSSEGLVETASLDLPANSMTSSIIEVSNDKAYLAGYTSGKLWVINPKTLQKTGEIDLTSYAHTDSSPEPSCGYARDGLYYLPLNQAAAPNYMPYADYLQTDVAIIDIATDNVLKVISEKTTGLIYPVRPMLKNMIFANEQKDIYIACSGYFAMNPAYKKSGFVCIPNGKQEFDTSKSWDVSETTIEGTSYKPASVLNCKYAGNGKLVAFVGIAELMGANPYTSKNLMAVTIDLEAKTIKKINGIPLTDGYSASINSYKNLVVLSVYGEDKSGFYTYNPANEEVKFQLSTVGNPVFFHSFE